MGLALAMPLALAAAPFQDTMAQRLLACTACHGEQGRAGPDGFYPRLAGKPAGYLYQQLLNFRDGQRHHGLMARMLEPLDNAYLWQIAQHFAAQQVPYPAPAAQRADAALLRRGERLAREGDTSRRLSACASCHGAALTGVLPATPGLLGLPRDYLSAQLGAWRAGQRSAHAPDCMADVARAMDLADVNAVATWLAAQPVPANSAPVARLPQPAPQRCGSVAPPAPENVAVVAADLATPVARGAYLARAGNCLGCHTARGGAPGAGGRGITTPFGTVYAGNLTPERSTGIGEWSADDFWRALNQGRSRDGRLLYPAFPYTSYTQVSRADADALYAYLRTLPPVVRTNTPHTLRWPYRTQTALALWRWLYFTPGEFRTDPQHNAEWNRGAYLVRGLGHCAACHSARDALGGSSEGLAGGLIPAQNWYAPSLSDPQQAGLTDWPLADIVTLLKTGTAPRATVLGPMAEVVQHSTQHLREDDLRAMAIYLKSLPVVTPPAPARLTPVPAAQAQRGAKLYGQHCAQCHGERGEGVTGAYPPLAGNRAVTLRDSSNLVQVVLNGGFAPSTAGQPRPFGMPPFVLVLDDADTAAVLTHIRNTWGHAAGPVSELDVARQRSSVR